MILIHVILVGMALAYLWAYINTSFPELPDWVIHFLAIPLMSLGLWFCPVIVLTTLAPCVIVLLVATVTPKRTKRQKQPKYQSKVPPLP